MSLEDRQLLQDFIKGDNSAFETLFKTYYEPVCRYIIRIIKDQDTTEEIVQSTFVNLWEKRDLIREDISFRSYLFRAAYNTALNYLKHKKVVHSYVNSKQERITEIQSSFVSHQPDFEIEKRIKDALSDLPPQCQRVFRMSREEGLKYQEIADELGISKKTVEVHMGKALKMLRNSLKDYLAIIIFLLNFM